jgi:hypothetical protein
MSIHRVVKPSASSSLRKSAARDIHHLREESDLRLAMRGNPVADLSLGGRQGLGGEGVRGEAEQKELGAETPERGVHAQEFR